MYIIEHRRDSGSGYIPIRAFPNSAGYNFWAAERKNLKPWSRELIKFDLNISIPKRSYGRIVGRSGLANTWYYCPQWNDWFELLIISNLSNEEYIVKRDIRIGQLIIELYYNLKFIEVHEFSDQKRAEWFWLLWCLM